MFHNNNTENITPEDQIKEVAEILAKGYLRFIKNQASKNKIKKLRESEIFSNNNT
jgi:hypothetical protein